MYKGQLINVMDICRCLPIANKALIETVLKATMHLRMLRRRANLIDKAVMNKDLFKTKNNRLR